MKTLEQIAQETAENIFNQIEIDNIGRTDGAEIIIATLQQREQEHEAQVTTVLESIRKFMGSGAGLAEIVQVIEDRVAAEAVLSEGEYEAADGMEDVVRWMKAEHEAQVASLIKERDDVTRLLEDAREDVKRLDWLETAPKEDESPWPTWTSDGWVIVEMIGMHTRCAGPIQITLPTLRAAITQAMTGGAE